MSVFERTETAVTVALVRWVAAGQHYGAVPPPAWWWRAWWEQENERRRRRGFAPLPPGLAREIKARLARAQGVA